LGAIVGGRTRIPRDPFHHLFPQGLADEFLSRGIDPHDFTMQIPRELHVDIHRGGPNGGLWNAAWEDFFANNPDASKADIMNHLPGVIDKFDLPKNPVVRYPRAPRVGISQ
jgi:hypothetical protein